MLHGFRAGVSRHQVVEMLHGFGAGDCECNAAKGSRRRICGALRVLDWRYNENVPGTECGAGCPSWRAIIGFTDKFGCWLYVFESYLAFSLGWVQPCTGVLPCLASVPSRLDSPG